MMLLMIKVTACMQTGAASHHCAAHETLAILIVLKRGADGIVWTGRKEVV